MILVHIFVHSGVYNCNSINSVTSEKTVMKEKYFLDRQILFLLLTHQERAFLVIIHVPNAELGLTQDRGAANLAEIGCIMIIMIVLPYNIKISAHISFA